MRPVDKIWEQQPAASIVQVLCAVDGEAEMQRVLQDVLTKQEITEISSRLEAAKMLADGSKYTDIAKKTKLSSRTIARISDWLKNGCGGYAIAIKAMADSDSEHHS